MEKSEKSIIGCIGVGSLVVDRDDPARVGLVCVGAFRMSEGPGAWVLWPEEDYSWIALSDIEPVTASIGA